jgi:type II secretory pathway pseudopilin PulG
LLTGLGTMVWRSARFRQSQPTGPTVPSRRSRLGFGLLEIAVAALVLGGGLAGVLGLLRTFSIDAGMQRDAELTAGLALDALEWVATADVAGDEAAGEVQVEEDLTAAVLEQEAFRRAILTPREDDPAYRVLSPRLTVHLTRDRTSGSGEATPGIHRLVCRVLWMARGQDGRPHERAVQVGRLLIR